mmetsp:Transcript_23563/g.39988  ORF Transcript_23563/g.39988 Transcript_23563/m.39988 type:complete len:321 (-) Transcript_23563:379-1341(-)
MSLFIASSFAPKVLCIMHRRKPTTQVIALALHVSQVHSDPTITILIRHTIAVCHEPTKRCFESPPQVPSRPDIENTEKMLPLIEAPAQQHSDDETESAPDCIQLDDTKMCRSPSCPTRRRRLVDFTLTKHDIENGRKKHEVESDVAQSTTGMETLLVPNFRSLEQSLQTLPSLLPGATVSSTNGDPSHGVDVDKEEEVKEDARIEFLFKIPNKSQRKCRNTDNVDDILDPASASSSLCRHVCSALLSSSTSTSEANGFPSASNVIIKHHELCLRSQHNRHRRVRSWDTRPRKSLLFRERDYNDDDDDDELLATDSVQSLY